MNSSIPPGINASYNPAGASAQASNLRNRLGEYFRTHAAAGQHAAPVGDRFIRGSVNAGIWRAIRMTVCRPFRSIAEFMLLHSWAGLITLPIMMGKHFVEGVVGADSLFIKRKWPFGLPTPFSGAKSHGGRTVWEAIQQSFLKKKPPTA